MATRQDCNNVFEMTNAAIAMFYHYAALKLKVLRHLYCGKGKDSCFKWQSDKETGEITYKKKIASRESETNKAYIWRPGWYKVAWKMFPMKNMKL